MAGNHARPPGRQAKGFSEIFSGYDNLYGSEVVAEFARLNQQYTGVPRTADMLVQKEVAGLGCGHAKEKLQRAVEDFDPEDIATTEQLLRLRDAQSAVQGGHFRVRDHFLKEMKDKVNDVERAEEQLKQKKEDYDTTVRGMKADQQQEVERLAAEREKDAKEWAEERERLQQQLKELGDMKVSVDKIEKSLIPKADPQAAKALSELRQSVNAVSDELQRQRTADPALEQEKRKRKDAQAKHDSLLQRYKELQEQAKKAEEEAERCRADAESTGAQCKSATESAERRRQRAENYKAELEKAEQSLMSVRSRKAEATGLLLKLAEQKGMWEQKATLEREDHEVALEALAEDIRLRLETAKQAKDERRRHAAEKKDLLAKLEDAEEKLVGVGNDIVQLRADLGLARKEVEDRKRIVDEFTTSLRDRLERDAKSKASSLGVVQAELSDVKEKFASVKQERDEMTRQRNTRDGEVKQLTLDATAKDDEMRELRADIEERDQTIEDLRGQLESMESEVTSVRKERDLRASENAALEKEKNELKSAEEVLAEKLQSLSLVMKYLTAKHINAQRELKEEVAEKERGRNRITALEDLASDATESLTRAREELLIEQSLRIADCEAWAKEKKSLTAENATLTATLRSREAALKEKSTTNSDLVKEIEAKVTELEKASNLRTELIEKSQELAAAEEKVRTEKSKRDSEVGEAEKEANRLVATAKAKHMKELDSKTRDVETLEQAVSDEQHACQELQSRLNELQINANATAAELQALKDGQPARDKAAVKAHLRRMLSELAGGSTQEQRRSVRLPKPLVPDFDVNEKSAAFVHQLKHIPRLEQLKQDAEGLVRVREAEIDRLRDSEAALKVQLQSKQAICRTAMQQLRISCELNETLDRMNERHKRRWQRVLDDIPLAFREQFAARAREEEDGQE